MLNQAAAPNSMTKRTKPICLCLMMLLGSLAANAETTISKHHQIMAGFLLHLTSFTQWPAAEHLNFKLCILGEDPFKGYLDSMLKRRPKNRLGQDIVVSRIEENAIQQLSTCQLVFVHPQQYQKLWQHLSPSHTTLLVSQGRDFINQGGMINFTLDKKKVKLEVNLPAVNAAKLKISSELLKHAKVIQGKTHLQVETNWGANVAK